MSVHHSCHVCPLAKFQAIPLPLRRRNYGPTLKFVRPYCVNEQESKFVGVNKDKSWEASRSRSSSDSSKGWIDKWKESRKTSPPKPPRPPLNYRSRENELSSFSSSGNSSGGSGAGGGSTMERIVEKLKKFGYMDDEEEVDGERERVIEKGSIDDIFYVEEGMLPNTHGGFSKDSSLAIERAFEGEEEVRFPWEKPAAKQEAEDTLRRRSRTHMAELTLPQSELTRLKHLTLRTKQKLRIKGAGVTEAIVDAIHDKWKEAEIVRIKVEGAPALNMRRMHEILERKTGGLVIWRSGTSISLYRGVSYKVPLVEQKRQTF